MRREAERPRSRAVAAAAVATAAFALFLVLRFSQVALAVHLYAVAMGLIVGAGLAARALGGVRSQSERRRPLRWRRRRPRPDRVRELEELEHAVDFAVTTAFDVHYRLRPHLVRVARHRLNARHGVLLEAQPEAARRLLGEEAWELVRPDREPPAHRNAPGLPLGRLARVVDALEAL